MDKTIASKQKNNLSRSELYSVVLLCLICFFLLADQNLMAPNLTKIARDFGMSDLERDTLLGGRIALGFWLLGGVVTLFIGYLTDKLSRKKVFLAVVLVGEIPCLLTAFAQNYTQLFILRAFTGIGIGGVLPITNSLMGDMFSKRNRTTIFGIINVAGGLGIAVGQMVAGFTTDLCIGPLCGWRIPFVVIALPGFLVALLFWFTTKEPPRGNTEESLKELFESGKAYTGRINWSDYKNLFRNKTNLLLLFQTLPGVIPWSVMFVFLNDFLAQEKAYSVQTATMICMIFGVGILAGIGISGYIGDLILRRSPKWFAFFAGITVFVGVFPTFMVLTFPSQAGVENPNLIGLAVLALVAGLIIAPAGPITRSMIVNVNLPEARGSMTSIFNIVDDLGRGFGPFIVSMLIVAFGRETAFILSPFFWVPCAIGFFIIGYTLPRDMAALDRTLHQRATEMAGKPS